MILQKQLSLADIYSHCSSSLEGNKSHFLSLLEEHIPLDSYIPSSFRNHFYSDTGRPRRYSLQAFLWALIIQKVFSIPTDTLLILFLKYSVSIRTFCGFDKVPDASKFTRFKQDFLLDLQSFFDSLVDVTEPICQKIDASLASMSIFDTSGIEAYVTENNPKYADSSVRKLKAFKKAKKLPDSYDPYKAAYSLMPPHASANPAAKQLYINGHFCYVFKFGFITNGLGIIRDITCYNQQFLDAHPDIPVAKKSDSPDEDKSLSDSKALIPVLTDFFAKHEKIKPSVFLGDAAFDSTTIYKSLLTELHFSKAYIPLNSAHRTIYPDCPLNSDGIPCCPKDSSLPMKYEGSKSHLRSNIPTFKFVCPNMKWIKCSDGQYRRRHFCEHPCTDSLCGRMVYIYPEKDLRAYPGTLRGTDEWDRTYKIRGSVEQVIGHFKHAFCLAGRKTQNEKTTHADLLLAGITQLITVILADALLQHSLLRSLKSLAV